jgi:hypothetical protein
MSSRMTLHRRAFVKQLVETGALQALVQPPDLWVPERIGMGLFLTEWHRCRPGPAYPLRRMQTSRRLATDRRSAASSRSLIVRTKVGVEELEVEDADLMMMGRTRGAQRKAEVAWVRSATE